MSSINITVIKNFIKYFTSRQLEETASKVCFVKRRNGKLEVKTFFKVFTIGVWSLKNATLTQIAQLCEDNQEGLSITKQALHKRLGAGVEFLKQMFKLCMSYSIRHSSVINASNVLSQFKNVIICDSTYLTLPDKLRQFFRGPGGRGKSESGLKVQAEFNLTTRSFRNLTITEGVENDLSYLSSFLESVEENELIIHDLGYFSIKFLKDVDSKKAYFLTRMHSQIVFFSDLKQSKEKPLLLEEVLDVNKDIIDKQLFIGRDKETRMAVRVVAVRLPSKVINERLRKANKKAQSRGKTLSKRQKTLLAWNIIITNVQADKLTAILALELYRIRWQIEIIFKAWKSHLRLSNVAYGGKAQMECLLYGRLIVITLMTAIYSQFYLVMIISKNREVSMLKFFSLLTSKAKEVADCIHFRIDYSHDLLNVFTKVAAKSLYERRKRLSTLGLILSCNKPVLDKCG